MRKKVIETTEMLNKQMGDALIELLKEKILNQLLDPFLTTPSPGIKTSINKIKQINIIKLAFS